MKKNIFPLALGALGLGLTEYVMMGLLAEVATAQHITMVQAGHLISAYALGVVVGAPVFTFLLSGRPYKQSLIALMLMFTLFNMLTILSPNYTFLFISRFLSGLPHGAFFGIGAIVAGKIAHLGKETQAVSQMFSGLAFANLAGVPLGTYLGQQSSWHTTYGIIAAVGLIAAVAIYKLVPSVSSEEHTSAGKQLLFFKKADSWIAMLMTSVGIAGLFCWISYISPLMTEVSGFHTRDISLILMLAGMGMLFGNRVGGYLADRNSPSKALLYLLILLGISLLLVYAYSGVKFLSLVLTFMTGALAYATVAPFQMVMIGASRGSEIMGGSMTHAAFNLGNALGAYLGGLPLLIGYGFNYASLVGAVMSFAGTGLTFWFIQRARHNRQQYF